MDPVSLTALWMAAERARESARPDRLFADPLAEALAGPEGKKIMVEMGADIPENPAIPIRTRYFDDRLLATVGTGQITQVVLVAAGMDTRAFRLALPPDVIIYELDRPQLLALKQQRLSEAGARPTCGRRTVPVDVTSRWSDDLLLAGFAVTEPAVFVVEGLLGYLEEPLVHHLFDTVASLAGSGSVLLADVSGPTPSDAPYLAAWFARLEKAGISRRFATDDPEGLCAAHGWHADVAEYGDESANYGRWPWPSVDRHDPNWPHNYLITAFRRDKDQG